MKPVYRNLILLCLFFCLVACLWHFGDLKAYVNLTTIKDNQQFLHAYINNNPLLSGMIYTLTFFILTLSALPVTLVMITIGGFLFGSIIGSIYAFIAIIATSLCIFKLSKKLFGHYLQEKYSHELTKFNDNFKRYGFYYLIIVRALPVIPFFIVNLTAGFTHVPTKTFIITTAIGALPTILFCSYLGSQCASLIVNW